jgi:hypothetical protein
MSFLKKKLIVFLFKKKTFKKILKINNQTWSDKVRCGHMWSYAVICGQMWLYVVKDSI